MSDRVEWISEQFKESARIQTILSQQDSSLVAETAETMISALKAGNKLLVCGNGGSAADAQHFAAELVGRFMMDRRPLPAIALTTDTSILTAIGNDYSYTDIFERQVEALGQKGDVLVGMSTSGHSENVIQAFMAAQAKHISTIALLGKEGGQILSMADQAIVVPHQLSSRIQEGHITIIHIWCELFERELFGE
jgi:D-sedoheptulose 7-phosphate isomerase